MACLSCLGRCRPIARAVCLGYERTSFAPRASQRARVSVGRRGQLVGGRWSLRAIGAAASSGGADMRVAVRDSVSLEPEEEELFNVLLGAAKHHGLSTTLRCAGGWVRDKLLGITSPDIDVVLDDMLGREFAEKVNEYLHHLGKETAGVGVIQMNPDQSKHLETARMRVNGTWIDLVNLRSETYAEGSRIPSMEFGTPLQDALRRDLTINALFYNLHTRAIEDFTGHGVDDLRNGIVRTPLAPAQTFLDDPLRVLRAVRFAARLGFDSDPALLEAASTAEVRAALAHKVSRERVGIEVAKMLEGPRPGMAIGLLHDMGLLGTAFAMPDGCTAPASWTAAGAACGRAWAEVLGRLSRREAAAWVREMDSDATRATMLAAVLLPLRYARVPADKKPLGVPGKVVRGMKLRGRDADDADRLATSLAGLASVAPGPEEGEGGEGGSHTGRLGKAMVDAGSYWRVAMAMAPLTALRECAPLGAEELPAVEAEGAHAMAQLLGLGEGGVEWGSLDAAKREELAERMVDVALGAVAFAEAVGLADCHTWKPLLGGKEITAELGAKGPAIGKVVEMLTAWQLRHPATAKSERGKAEALAYLKREWGQGGR